jgi:hypothetical protein
LDPTPEEEVRRPAYEIYEERGYQDGRDVEDWLRAETEITDTRVKAAAYPAPTHRRAEAPAAGTSAKTGSPRKLGRECPLSRKIRIRTVPNLKRWSSRCTGRAFPIPSTPRIQEALRSHGSYTTLIGTRPKLRMHRNTFARTLSELHLDIRALRKAKRCPVRGVDPKGRRNSPAKQRRTGRMVLDRGVAKEHASSIAKSIPFLATRGQSGTQERTR